MSAGEFGRLLDALGPFEARPLLAVAVSGGADSMALALLADSWARRRGGKILGLTVDHGLRPDSASEARRVRSWLGGRGIGHRTLRWRDPSRRARQADARAARHGLLAGACAKAGILHLLFAHHLEDQAETVLLRLGRGSGPDGLAAMAAIGAVPGPERGARLLRPLLGIPKARLTATLRHFRQPWIEDPSNRDPAYARVRMRALMPALAREGLTAARLAGAARLLGRARGLADDAVAELLARAAAVHAAGYVVLDRALLMAAAPDLGTRALARCLAVAGASTFPPRTERLERLYGALQAGLGGGRTLAGCRILPWDGALLICRERSAPPVRLPRAGMVAWDGRFRVEIRGRRALAVGALVGALGDQGWAEAVRADPRLRQAAIPRPARAHLPAVFDAAGVVAVPHLGYFRQGEAALPVTIAFTPGFALAGQRFTVV